MSERPGSASRIFRVLRRIVVWGALTLLALFLAALAINAFDEHPSPQALALRQPPENRYKPEQNLYVALAGFDAPAGQSVVTFGQARIARYNELADLHLRDPLVMPATDEPHGLEFAGSADFCRPQNRTFWEDVRANGPKLAHLTDENHELYERYLALFSLAGYYDTARPSPVAPFYSVPTAVRDLFLANVSLEIQSGDGARMQAALKSLRQDVDLWHRMLIGEGLPVSKLIAAANLKTDFGIIANMIADPRVAIPKDMRDVLPESDMRDWNIGESFAAEYRVHSFIYRQVQALSDRHWHPPGTTRAQLVWGHIEGPIEGQFFKINATENLDAEAMTKLGGLAALGPSTFSTQMARLSEWEQDSANVLSIRTIYNPIGKILVAIAAPAYEDYLLRPYDVAAFERLVHLSFEIRQQQIPSSAIAAFLKAHPEWSTHPADGRSFLWNPTTSEISVQPVAHERADRRFSVHIWRRSET